MIENRTSLPVIFQTGLTTFNQSAFYEAHERFEAAWRQTPGEEREFFRAFLHLSGGFFRLTQGRPKAARKFFAHAQKWLASFPDCFHGFDVSQLLCHVQLLMDAIDQQAPSTDILQDLFQPIHPQEGHCQ